MGSKEIVLNFLYSIIVGKGLLISFFGSNILCRTYYEFSKLRIVTLNMVKKSSPIIITCNRFHRGIPRATSTPYITPYTTILSLEAFTAFSRVRIL